MVIGGLVACACGPTVGTGDGSQSGGGNSTTAADATSDMSASAEVGTSPTTEATATASTTDNVDEACVLADPAACPDGCAADYALEVIDDVCTTSSVLVCVAGGPKPGVPPTTWWTTAASGPVFAEYGGDSCSAAAQPGEGWQECSGSPDEPPDCACFCQQGYCLGDQDRRALDACGLESPCPVLYVDPRFGAVDHEAETCVLEGLRDRVAGIYEITLSGSFGSDTVRYYVFGEEVERITFASDDVILCPLVSDWSTAARCALQPSEFFASCLAPPGPETPCVATPEEWVLDCIDDAPACE